MFRSHKLLQSLTNPSKSILTFPGRSFASTPAPKITKLNKILIANRGEIACRVIRTAKRLGIKTVAVYSDSDANSDHVKLADEAVHIGDSPASESYLRGDKIIQACLSTGAQAVHPGYGFLSENLPFCQLCTDNNIIFIGPPPKAIKAMGSKSESKDIMINANVPVTPGYHGEDQSNEKLLAEAKKIGFPLMIKAVSGGGGKGMRAVFEESKFLESLDGCRREAKRSFNDDVVLLEKLIHSPRHVELQIFGGPDGKAVHLLERDCSVQRRHQKVLEEAPAPNLDPKIRAEMARAAVACAEAVGYVGAGTVEFLVDSKTSEFYFCEMNTRLQVEHPVTEMITGTDLVEWQLLVAAGQPIPLTQAQIIAQSKGCAIEARIYAENPMKEFLPATGLVTHLKNPALDSFEPGVRVDTGMSEGNTISTFYDPMIAKLIAYGETRTEALDKLERALRRFQVAGLANNIDFLVSVIQEDEFREAKATTAFFERHMSNILTSLQSIDKKELTSFATFAAAGLYLTQCGKSSVNHIWNSKDTNDWRHTAQVNYTYDLTHGGEHKIQTKFNVDKSGKIAFHLHDIQHPHAAYPTQDVTVLSATPARNVPGAITWDLVLAIDGHRVSGTVNIYKNAPNKVDIVDVWMNAQSGANKSHYQFALPHMDKSAIGSSSKNPFILSPMPGKVVKIVVQDGQKISKGETVAILEAMKMEHVVVAPSDGIIKVFCNEGETVAEGTKLAEVVKENEVKQ